jgi:hypothetical protein
MKRIQDTPEYKMVKQMTSKENKKALKKATIDMLILIGAFYIATFAFVKLVFWIWQ